MTPSSKPTRVMVIGSPGPTAEQVTNALTAQTEFELLDIVSNLEKLTRMIRAAEAEILLVDHQVGNQPGLDLIDDLAVQFPNLAIVAILPASDPVLAQQVMLAGARAFIVQPFTQVNLLSTLRRVHDLESRRQQPVISAGQLAAETSTRLRTLSVYSPRGGAGTSTIAVNLAIALQEETGQRVLLVDGKLAFGHLGLMLNIRSQNSIADLLPHASALDKTLVTDVVLAHASGIHVLPSPSNIQVAQGIRTQDLFNVLSALQPMFDYIVLDTGSQLSDNTVTLLDASDRILLLTNPDLASLYDVSKFIQVGRSLAYPTDKMLVVLNRANLEGGIKPGDVEAVLKQELFTQIPDAGADAWRSLNRGIPLLLKYGRNPASKAIRGMAGKLLDLAAAGAAVQVEPASSKRRQLSLSRSG